MAGILFCADAGQGIHVPVPYPLVFTAPSG